MDSADAVAIAVVACGTAIGGIDLLVNKDGAILSAMIGLYGAVLGFVFGKQVITSGTSSTTSSTSTTNTPA